MNLLSGFKDTISILALKWGSIKKKRTKALILFALSMFALTLYGMAYIGSALLKILTIDVGDGNDLIKSFMTQYLTSFANGELDVYVSGVFGATILTILVLPFSGYSLGGIVPTRDMSIVKSNNNYRLSDSILIQFASALSILQLISLTVLSSLISIEGGTGPAVVYAWTTWIAIVFTTVAFMWIIEYINRRYGKKVKGSLILGILVAMVLAVLLDPFHGTTFFGLSPIYVDVLQNIYTYNVVNYLIAYGVVIILLILFASTINFVGSKALMLPEPVAIKEKNAKNITLATKRWSKITLGHLIRLIVLRYKIIWRPILITVIFSSGLLIVLGTNDISGTLSSVMIIVPLVICLSFGINMFGILGSSNIWLLSMPKWRETILYRLIGIQLTVIGISYFIVIGSGLSFQRVAFSDVLSSLPGLISTSIIMIIYSVSRSLKSPVKYTASSRGDAILPAMMLLGYMVKFMMLGGFIGIISFWAPSIVQWGILLAVITISVVWFVSLNNKWLTDEAYINNIIQETTSD